MKKLNIYSTSLVTLLALIAFDANANQYNISDAKLNEIESRVDTMSYDS